MDSEGAAEPPGRVLVVEDDAVNRKALARGVEREGHLVLAAADGKAALNALRSEPVDLVLLDLLMPVLDGFAVLEEMRRSPELRDVAVLVISAVDDSERIARAIEMGAIDVLPKPFDPVLLRARLRTALQWVRLRRLEQDYLRQEVALRQHEKLATIGRLSAGLAHELNNPAAAARRTIERLNDQLGELAALATSVAAHAAGATIMARSAEVGQRPAPYGLGASERMAAEDALEAALARTGAPGAARLAGRLAAVGARPEEVDAEARGLDPDAAQLCVEWTMLRLEVRAALEQLGVSITRISDIVGALRSYSFLDRAPEQDVDVRQGLDDSLTVLGHELGDRITVVREYEADLPAVPALGHELNQVWTNLIDNAIDAVGESGTITLRAWSEPDAVLASVSDDGPGIPSDLIGRVFDPFVTTKPPGKGTGLGLNISYQIVTEGHGGRLGIESAPGRTTFIVRLPKTGRGAP